MAPYFSEVGLRPAHLQETTFGNLASTYRNKEARNKVLLFRGSAVADFQWIRAIQGQPYGSINAPADEELVALTDEWEMIVDPGRQEGGDASHRRLVLQLLLGHTALLGEGGGSD